MRRLLLALAAIAAYFIFNAASCNPPPADCGLCETTMGTTSDGRDCSCTFCFTSLDGVTRGSVCHTNCSEPGCDAMPPP